MTILKTLYINPMVDLSYVFLRFREILKNEYNSFWERCSSFSSVSDNRYIIYHYPTDTRRVKLLFISNYPPSLERNNSYYYISNPNDADISGIVNIFVKDCKNYACRPDDIDLVAGIKTEMRKMLDKEIARGIMLNRKKPSITKALYLDPATIVFWDDGTKTVVKCQEGDKYSYAEGIMHAIIRKIFGDDNKQYSDILKWISTAEEYDKAYEAVSREEENEKL